MNKRRRIGRGGVPREVLNRLSVKDRTYTFQQFRYEQERRYLASLTRVGANYWEPEDEWSDG